MMNVNSKALNQTIQIDRIIGHIPGSRPGPTFIFTAGIHGNEPSGVFALKKVLEEICSNSIPFTGNLFAIAGNLSALEAGIRFQHEDLNRMWTEKRMNALLHADKEVKNGEIAKQSELREQSELRQLISEILVKETGPFYFMDLHTTSSPTSPFITVNDNLLNRKFTQQYPAPLLLGIEEYLDGTFLNHINALGYVAFGFESGQHDALSSIENHVAFIYLTLALAGSVSKADSHFEVHRGVLVDATQKLASTYEIVYHHKIQRNEKFTTLPGFQNFEPVTKNQEIAHSNGEPVKTPKSGLIFMPLYQKKGEDGFFIIKPVPKIFLRLSALLRQIHFDYILALLPGISWVSEKRNALKVDLKIARFLAKKFFHLLGYRSRQIDETHMVVRNREAASKRKDYEGEIWY